MDITRMRINITVEGNANARSDTDHLIHKQGQKDEYR